MLFLIGNADGSHVRADINRMWEGDAARDEYVCVGAGGDGWKGFLRVLENVHAEGRAGRGRRGGVAVRTRGRRISAERRNAGAGTDRARRSASTRDPPAHCPAEVTPSRERADDVETAFGTCTGIVDFTVPRIMALMAALPCNLPGHVDGWMRKQGFHLQRILAAEPRAEDGFRRSQVAL